MLWGEREALHDKFYFISLVALPQRLLPQWASPLDPWQSCLIYAVFCLAGWRRGWVGCLMGCSVSNGQQLCLRLEMAQSCPQRPERKGSIALAPLWLVLFTLLKMLLNVFPVVHSENSKIAQIIIKYMPAWTKNQDLRIYSVIRYIRKSLICKSLLLLLEFLQNPHYSRLQVAPSAVPVPSRSCQSDASTLAAPLGQLAKYFLLWNNQIA